MKLHSILYLLVAIATIIVLVCSCESAKRGAIHSRSSYIVLHHSRYNKNWLLNNYYKTI